MHSRPAPTIFSHEFSLADRVALVSGAERGIGLEMALALVEAGARAVYCLDLPKTPGEEWTKVNAYAKGLEGKTGGAARLEYVSADVTDQVRLGLGLGLGCGGVRGWLRTDWQADPAAGVSLSLAGSDVEDWEDDRG